MIREPDLVVQAESRLAGIESLRHAPDVPPMDLDSSRHGWPGRVVKRLVARLLSYHSFYQQRVNLAFAAFQRELELRSDRQALEIATALAQIDTLSAAGEGLRQRLEELSALIAARPYMAYDAFGTIGDPSDVMGYGPEAGRALEGQARFEELFRGSAEFIAERQRIYVPFFTKCSNVLDVGAGRGEFLQLLEQAGIPAVGVDLDPVLCERCREQGLNVLCVDAFDYLASSADESFDGVFCAQVIEHFESSRLIEFLGLVRQKLRPGGVLVAETVNPESYAALKTFHVDLTHQRPIFPEVLLYLCHEAGYPSARVFYPQGGGFDQRNYAGCGEYAVVATR
ncbi:MAG: class I SAM-dependent methyltransferase [Chloroflexi bacterium]|nr:class I SAM-dependent methyltransferase [Chloroflexota bacterium]